MTVEVFVYICIAVSLLTLGAIMDYVVSKIRAKKKYGTLVVIDDHAESNAPLFYICVDDPNKIVELREGDKITFVLHHTDLQNSHPLL